MATDYSAMHRSLNILFLMACVAILSIAAQAQNSKKIASDNTVVVLLGTGTPRPDPKASGPATAIVVGKQVFLIDTGPGVERQLSAAHLPIDGVTALFVTHLHSDHTLGYPDLIFTSWVMGRKTALQAYGPHGLQNMTDHLIAAFAEDIKIRTEGLEHETPNGYKVSVHEIGPGIVYDSLGVRVKAIRVPHGNWSEAFAFRFDTPYRSVIVSGDTRYNEGLIEPARGIDVLVHEVYSASRLKPEARPGGEDWPKYMREFHTSDIELGALAARIQPKLLILSHVIRMGAPDDELLAGIRAGGFTGRVVVGHDLERY
jgi:ribonuclease BN (tRNA processing enzyme)